jgi:hypothetical protein
VGSQAAPTPGPDSGPMNAHFRQPLPNRRFRRLLPAALAAAALATASSAGPAAAKPTHAAHAKPPKPLVLTAPAAAVSRTPRAQPTSET